MSFHNVSFPKPATLMTQLKGLEHTSLEEIPDQEYEERFYAESEPLIQIDAQQYELFTVIYTLDGEPYEDTVARRFADGQVVDIYDHTLEESVPSVRGDIEGKIIERRIPPG